MATQIQVNRDSQGLLPLTVKQISDFAMDGVDVSKVKLVGMVFNKKETLTEIDFILDDETGRIDCHKWVNDSIKELTEIKNGMFLEIQGHLIGLKGKKHLEVISVRPVTHINQVAYRFTESSHVPCHDTKSQYDCQSTSAGINEKVLDFLSMTSNMRGEKGVHLDELAHHLKVPLEKIKEAVNALEYDGLVYSTIDDYHYKSEISRNGMFIENLGHLKGYRGTKHLEVFSVSPVTNIRQVAYRFMECTHESCHNTKSQWQGSTSAQPLITNAAITNGPLSYRTSPSNQFDWQSAFAGISKKILDFLSLPSQSVRKDEVHLDELAHHLKVPLEKIKEAVNALEKEGQVYWTIDECHYKSSSQG